jgi:hypothetical protein
MHENALVKHVRFAGWVGRVARCPAGERAGAFYRNDTTCFYVVWTAGRGAQGDALPENGWYPAADLARITR